MERRIGAEVNPVLLLYMILNTISSLETGKNFVFLSGTTSTI